MRCFPSLGKALMPCDQNITGDQKVTSAQSQHGALALDRSSFAAPPTMISATLPYAALTPGNFAGASLIIIFYVLPRAAPLLCGPKSSSSTVDWHFYTFRPLESEASFQPSMSHLLACIVIIALLRVCHPFVRFPPVIRQGFYICIRRTQRPFERPAGLELEHAQFHAEWGGAGGL